MNRTLHGARRTLHQARCTLLVALCTAATVLLFTPAAPKAAATSRIVSVVPAVTEMLYAIGSGPQVVGVSSYDKFPAEVEKLPKVGALIDPDFERILRLKPDLVIAYGTQTDFIAQLTRVKIPIFRYEHAGLADITQTMRKLGTAVGRPKEADAAAAAIERELEDVRRSVAGKPRYKTLLVFGREPGNLRGIYASAGIGFLHDLLLVAGGEDVFSDVKRQSMQVSSEQVLARAPEAIIELLPDPIPAQLLASERAQWLKLSSLPAARNGRVYLLADPVFMVPGPRVGLVARRFAEALHPR